MKITKSAGEAFAEKFVRREANMSCNSCPCCGETMTIGEAIQFGYGLSRGVSRCIGITDVRVGVFKTVTMYIDNWHCHSCGASWESKPW